MGNLDAGRDTGFLLERPQLLQASEADRSGSLLWSLLGRPVTGRLETCLEPRPSPLPPNAPGDPHPLSAHRGSLGNRGLATPPQDPTLPPLVLSGVLLTLFPPLLRHSWPVPRFLSLQSSPVSRVVFYQLSHQPGFLLLRGASRLAHSAWPLVSPPCIHIYRGLGYLLVSLSTACPPLDCGDRGLGVLLPAVAPALCLAHRRCSINSC